MDNYKDMVVLNRNSINDATHINFKTNTPFLVQGSKEYFYLNNKWILSDSVNDLKPIEKKEMKEFLVNHDGKWTLRLLDSDTEENSYRVSVPSGADIYVYFSGNKKAYFYNPSNEIFENHWMDASCKVWSFNEIKRGIAGEILWQRSETEYLMQGENGDKLMESISKLKNQETVKVTIDELKNSVGVEPNKTTVGKLNSQWDFQVGGDHYKSMKIQPAKFALENKLDYCQANAIKYICRHDSKNGKQDLEKAKHYIDLLIEHYYGDEDE